jgi:hypothetical protein
LKKRNKRAFFTLPCPHLKSLEEQPDREQIAIINHALPEKFIIFSLSLKILI